MLLDRVEEPASFGLRDAHAYRAELRCLLLEAIDELPPTYRAAAQLRDIEDRPSTDVARRLHVTKQNVTVRLQRAHRLLHARLLRYRRKGQSWSGTTGYPPTQAFAQTRGHLRHLPGPGWREDDVDASREPESGTGCEVHDRRSRTRRESDRGGGTAFAAP